MRPIRHTLQDFAGRQVTLPGDKQSWERLNPGQNEDRSTLLLGLGPTNPFTGKVSWLETPETLAQLKTIPDFNIPHDWEQITPQKALKLSRSCKIYFYRHAMRLSPDFWGHFLAHLDLAQIPSSLPNKKHTAWLPGSPTQLLHQELRLSLQRSSYQIYENPTVPQNASGFLKFFDGAPPSLALSVNFRGLDPGGRIFNLLNVLEIPHAIWLVDNPWHLLSSLRLPWWRQANIFVTDKSFLEPLKEHGAKNVHVCPLACAPHMWQNPDKRKISSPIFVGRSQFPGRDAFFGKTKPDTALMTQAQQMLNKNELPDYHWWTKKLTASPWPGIGGRAPGLGAELCSALNRGRWLQAAQNLSIVGDDAWREILPNARVSPPVDYYSDLPKLYNSYLCTLNFTSLLLPQSLSQRHFDVWAAGGFLLTDATKGLDIFPQWLVQPISLNSPTQLEQRLDWLASHPVSAYDLSCSWRECLASGHLYQHRLQQMFPEKIFI